MHFFSSPSPLNCFSLVSASEWRSVLLHDASGASLGLRVDGAGPDTRGCLRAQQQNSINAVYRFTLHRDGWEDEGRGHAEATPSRLMAEENSTMIFRLVVVQCDHVRARPHAATGMQSVKSAFDRLRSQLLRVAEPLRPKYFSPVVFGIYLPNCHGNVQANPVCQQISCMQTCDSLQAHYYVCFPFQVSRACWQLQRAV